MRFERENPIVQDPSNTDNATDLKQDILRRTNAMIKFAHQQRIFNGLHHQHVGRGTPHLVQLTHSSHITKTTSYPCEGNTVPHCGDIQLARNL